MGNRGSSKATYSARQKGIPTPGANRGDRLIKERVHDPYKTRSKLPEPTVCSECQAVFTQGRWSWAEVPANANQALCPACQRIPGSCRIPDFEWSILSKAPSRDLKPNSQQGGKRKGTAPLKTDHEYRRTRTLRSIYPGEWERI